jgi:hypothetical protein
VLPPASLARIPQPASVDRVAALTAKMQFEISAPSSQMTPGRSRLFTDDRFADRLI